MDADGLDRARHGEVAAGTGSAGRAARRQAIGPPGELPAPWYRPRNPLAAGFRSAVSALDRLLRRSAGIIEYSSEAKCICRMNLARSEREVRLADGTHLRKGDPFIYVHLWSEHVPEVDRGGASFRWARWMGMAHMYSLRLLAEYLHGKPEFADARAVRTNFNFGSPRRSRDLTRFAAGFGFEQVKDEPRSPFGVVHLFGENILLGLMVLAFNPRTFRWSILVRGRSDSYMGRAAFDRFYGAAEPPR